MTVRGSVAAVPADDDAWNEEAQRAFESALPVILAEVFDEPRLRLLPEAICDGAEELVPDVAVSMDGFDPRRLAGRVFDEPLAPQDDEDTIAMLDIRPRGTEVRIPLRHGGVRLGELVVGRPGGRWIRAQERAQLRSFADVVAPLLYARLEAEELRRAALTDQLTGLANRRALDNELDRICRSGVDVCLLLLDVDGLKEVNDELGYQQGDHLIAALARSITEAVDEGTVAARMGGDEFVVILPDVTEKQARRQAKRILRRFRRQPLHRRVGEISGGVSVGVVEGRPGETPRDLVRRAARSMRGNKRRRRTDRR
ncbi:MAG TPA: diguanylate cyclase [Gaiellales bacterium]|jgi:diguanylate cyclase (GGDEF)-like protein|nr:diguanylate cyclase [Gaiellales bacterium]